MLSKKIRQYLIDFLVGSLWVQSESDDRFQRRFEAIGYTDDPEQMKLYPIVIILRASSRWTSTAPRSRCLPSR